MFNLQLFDRLGNALNEGDIVKVSNSRGFSFYAEVKYLEDCKVIAPFHTFTFHSFEKVDAVPEGLNKSTETRYDIWYHDKAEDDEHSEDFESYLMSWRECEYLLEKGCFQISKAIK